MSDGFKKCVLAIEKNCNGAYNTSLEILIVGFYSIFKGSEWKLQFIFPLDREEPGVVSMVMPQTLERNKDRIREKEKRM